LGFTFRTRTARSKSGAFLASFQPAISTDAQKKISGEIRRWRLHRRIGLTLAEIARLINPVVRGWMQYYAAFYRSALYPLLSRINAYLMRWIRKKYKAVAQHEEGRGLLATRHPPAPSALRPLGMGSWFLVVRMTRAR
jgi:hypothetical protein